ncbi:fluoride efflux transporter CrcB [Hazenella coriacea]|uniref:Fluoride-specific ion channel FluC n=1 Tax=Hazenella coriacea TaxID=1179467 RepID=A0A4V2UUS9_9BACL|nr:fluoride efflux transporter CrcB [Hazenella coriacea]TCS92840.1 CrcB protein [Hazenella coriacea]
MTPFIQLLLIGIGGSIGAMLRFFLSQKIVSQHPRWSRFPLATWIINFSGCFLLGILLGLQESSYFSWSMFLFPILTKGFLGGYTTLSTFSVEVVKLIQKKDWLTTTIYVSGSAISSLIALYFAKNLF